VAALPYSGFIIDAEVVVHDERGIPSFGRLQKRGRLTRRGDVERAAVELPASLYAFDLVYLTGFDLRDLDLLARKSLLQSILPTVGPLRFSEHVAAEGEAMFEQVERMGLEGIVAKRASSRYVTKRSRDWIKINAAKSDDFVIAGYAQARDGGNGFAALLLAQYRDGEPVFAGRVGTGFNRADARTLGALLDTLEPTAPFAGAPQEKGLVWLAGGPVAQVKYKERTSDGLLRQPVYLRIRDDKQAAECVWPGAADEPSDVNAEPTPEPVAESAPAPRVDFTNVDKVFWPAERYTKGDLIEYYRAISPWLLPYLHDRPVVLTRYPDGIDGKSFFQKDAPGYAPDWLRLETMWSEQAQREIRYFVLDDLPSLLYVANMASIPLHVWSSRIAALERPDWCILDLDPKGAPLTHVVKIARHLHALCDSIGLPSYAKTSGSTGVHVLIPLGARYTYEQSKTLAELLARFTAKSLPDIATIVRAVGDREGRVYLDYLQNGHGKLLVGPFSVRPLAGAPVSMPLKWSQLTSRLSLERYTIKTAPQLLSENGDPLAAILNDTIDMRAAIEQLQAQLADR
jgi:bifunctional non-homologous end joining protein LigD